MIQASIYNLLLSLVIIAPSYAENLQSAQNIFIIPKLESASPGRAIQLTDAIQLRLRRKLQKYQVSAYVFSPVEIESYDNIDELIKSITLKDNQRLFLITGTLKISPNRKANTKIKVIEYTPDSSHKIADKTFTGQGERWKWHISRRVVSFIVSDVISFTPPPASKPTELKWGNSIVRNGSFEKGKAPYKPANWDIVDNLCSYWIKLPNNGRCIKFDTNVNQNQAWDWWDALKKGANPADAPKPIPTDPPHYDSVGGIEGVKLYSDYIPITMGKTYLLCARIKGPAKGQAKIFVKGYALLPKAKSDKLIRREVWRMYMHCDTNGKTWRNYSQQFTIPAKLSPVRKKYSDGTVKFYTPKIEWIRVMLYAYWQVGNYYFDDITIREGYSTSGNPLSSDGNLR